MAPHTEVEKRDLHSRSAARKRVLLSPLMHTSRSADLPIPTIGFLWSTLLLVGTSWPAVAVATCITIPDRNIRSLQVLAAKDATRALKQVQARMDALGEEPRTASVDRDRAALYAVQAEAYGILELATQARSAASLGLQLAPDIHDPVHLELISQHAENIFDGTRLAEEIKAVEHARTAQPRGSPADTCLLVTQGVLENRQDRADLAIVSLTQAYRASASTVVTEAHIAAAAGLSVVMRGLRDYPQALALNQEEIDWETSHGATLSLSVSHFMRGQILKQAGAYKTAITEFADARKLSVALEDEQGIGYADLRICESHIELGELPSAREECANGLRIFTASQDAGAIKDAQLLMARIDLRDGRPERALATLNEVLDQDGADLAPSHVAAVYELRARANADLHHYRNAYGDLGEYARRFAAANETERLQQTGALRARFETDREIERNATLKRELAQSRERTNRQALELRWNAIVAVAGLSVIALLIYFLVVNFRFRQRLVKLAGQDGLTGLPNRRRAAQFATTALQSARASGQPLALAIIDMDHFKVINDRCGHAAGDHVLKEFARSGSDALRNTDLLARWGGEEFLLVMPGATLEVALANLERLRTLVCGIRLPASGVGLRVSLSAGVAMFEGNVKSLDDLVARADAALYTAKNDGRDAVRIADPNYVTGSHAIRRAQRS